MNRNGKFYIGKTKGGDLFYNIDFGNGGGGCGLLKTIKNWELIKYRAMATGESEHIASWEKVIEAKENNKDWEKEAEIEVRKMVAEVC